MDILRILGALLVPILIAFITNKDTNIFRHVILVKLLRAFMLVSLAVLFHQVLKQLESFTKDWSIILIIIISSFILHEIFIYYVKLSSSTKLVYGRAKKALRVQRKKNKGKLFELINRDNNILKNIFYFIFELDIMMIIFVAKRLIGTIAISIVIVYSLYITPSINFEQEVVIVDYLVFGITVLLGVTLAYFLSILITFPYLERIEFIGEYKSMKDFILKEEPVEIVNIGSSSTPDKFLIRAKDFFYMRLYIIEYNDKVRVFRTSSYYTDNLLGEYCNNLYDLNEIKHTNVNRMILSSNYNIVSNWDFTD